LKNKKSSDYLDIVSDLAFFSEYELQKQGESLKSQAKLWMFHQSNKEPRVMALLSTQAYFDNHKLLTKEKIQLIKLPLLITKFSFYPYDSTSFFCILTFLEVISN